MIEILGVISEFDEYEQTLTTPNALSGLITKNPLQNTLTVTIPSYTSQSPIDSPNTSLRTGKISWIYHHYRLKVDINFYQVDINVGLRNIIIIFVSFNQRVVIRRSNSYDNDHNSICQRYLE